ncbi:MAG: hypothetical protein Q8P08_02235, partial [bacterium]|nr:hypothetical protein [bacterium]
MTLTDLWDLLPAPETTDIQEDSPWLIHRIVKKKAKIEKEEKIVKSEQPKFRPEKEFTRPKKEGVFKRVFRRKAIG